jgi:hypothetical protein
VGGFDTSAILADPRLRFSCFEGDLRLAAGAPWPLYPVIFFAYMLLALIAIHPAAAAWHHFLRHDRVTSRMIDGAPDFRTAPIFLLRISPICARLFASSVDGC